MNVSEQGPLAQSILQHTKVVQIRRTILIVWGALIFSMGFVCYVFMKVPHQVELSVPLQIAAVIVGVFSFVIPNIVQRKLAVGGIDPLDAALGRLLITHVLRFALTEGAMILLLLANPKPGPAMNFAIYGVACVLMAFHFPNQRRIEEGLKPLHGKIIS